MERPEASIKPMGTMQMGCKEPSRRRTRKEEKRGKRPTPLGVEKGKIVER